MYERILVAIDDSEVAEQVLAMAQELAILSSGEVWVVHVHEGDPSKHASPTRHTNWDVRGMVDVAVGKLASAGVTAHAEINFNLYGYAAREIIYAAQAHEVGVIVMGSRGRGNLAGLLVGSTAHKVIHLPDRPVVVVR
jgi:nucleotide-binding universal stress UspA family protein